MALRLKYWLVTALFLVALSFSMERAAQAYVDPGSSLLLFQSVSAVVTGALFYFRQKIKRLFSKAERPAAATALPPVMDRQ